MDRIGGFGTVEKMIDLEFEKARQDTRLKSEY
jgi:hypothetical protein